MAEPCGACGAPRDDSNRFCSACGAPLETADQPTVLQGNSGSSHSALPNRILRCKGCAADVATSADSRSYVCPFCDTALVTELPLPEGRQRPEFIIGFAISAEEAKQKFWDWLKDNDWFRPGDLALKAVAEKQRGVYLPFWHFSMLADSRWSADIGQHWLRTEAYNMRGPDGKNRTATRTIQETEWFPLSGEHQRYYFGYMVPGAKGISFEESKLVQPYKLSALVRFRPYYLAGWMAEEYSIDRDQAIQQVKDEFRSRQAQEIAYFLPGDTQRNLQVDTDLQVNGSDLILLPVHVLSYRYKDRLFRFLVNGQTGKVIGEKPVSKRRIAGLVMSILAALILLAILIAWIASH
jgi:hypothetical protein